MEDKGRVTLKGEWRIGENDVEEGTANGRGYSRRRERQLEDKGKVTLKGEQRM